QGDQAIGRRDEEPKAPAPRPNGHQPTSPNPTTNQPANGSPSSRDDPATNKQLAYLQNLSKRQGLAPKGLEAKIEQVLGKPITVYDLSKRQAGAVIDSLAGNGRSTSKTTSGR